MTKMNLNPRTIEYLEILQEECAEVVQAISKIKRFGVDSYHPLDENKVTNIAHLIVELGDIQGMIELLQESELALLSFSSENISIAAQAKKEKVKKFLIT